MERVDREIEREREIGRENERDRLKHKAAAWLHSRRPLELFRQIFDS